MKTDVAALTDSAMHGRGYVHGGTEKAAEYVADRFHEIGLQPVGDSYFQPFSFAVNVYEAPLLLKAGKRELVPGRDFIADPSTGISRGKFAVQWFDSSHFKGADPPALRKKRIPAVVMEGITDPETVSKFHTFKIAALDRGPVIQVVPEKLTWSVGQRRHKHAALEVRSEVFPRNTKKIKLDVAPEMREVEAANVIGMLPGRRSDSCLVITAHYDHLGRMGEALFPGASDNASGTATLLDLAAHFAESPPPFDLYFIAFAAEEAGLLGSRFFTEHPAVDMNEIRFLLNLDLMGSAATGITAVNGRAQKAEMARMAAINSEFDYVPKIRLRGNAPNSDHYFFAEAGVPAVFIYTEGHITAYHDVDDLADGLDWTNYEGLFMLLRTFIETF
ncbi:MAG: M28 family metallopeptidase [Cryomorphaceae bacterium]